MRLIVITIILFLLTLTGCTPSVNEVAATAVVLGCWPYGAYKPNPTKTPLTTPTAALYAEPTRTPRPTPTDALRGTPIESFPECTPVSSVPTRTPTAVPTWTAYPKATQRPANFNSLAPQNTSNMPDFDTIGNIAVHPTEGWPAVVWSHWSLDFPDSGQVWVRTWSATGAGWGPAIAVTTEPVGKGAGEPAIAIDRRGRMHVIYAKADSSAVWYTYSDDRGATWSHAAALATPSVAGAEWAGFFQLKVDPAGQLHALYAVYDGSDGEGLDNVGYMHATLDPSGNWSGQYRFLAGRKQWRGDLAFVQLPSGAIRTVVMLGCNRACPHGQHPIIGYQDGGGAWQEASVSPDWRYAQENVNYVSGTGFTDRAGRKGVCFAWGQYAASGVFVRCSFDGGQSWGAIESVIFDGGGAWGEQGNGYHPTIAYVPAANALITISTFREPGDRVPYYAVLSYRTLDDGRWTPQRDPTAGELEAPIKLFINTPKNQGRDVKFAYNGDGVAWATWTELEANAEMYTAGFSPQGLLATNEGTH